MGNIYISFKPTWWRHYQKAKYKNLKTKIRHYTSMEQMPFLLWVMEGLGGGGFVFAFVGHKRSNNGSQLYKTL
jgi:hypothetical protein